MLDQGIESQQDLDFLIDAQAQKLQEKLFFLQKLPIFTGISKQSLHKLSEYFIELKYVKNQIVYKQNSPVTMIYFIQTGEFQVYKNTEKPIKKIIEVPSEFLSSQKSLIRIENAREIKHSYQTQVFIKEKNEILGYDDYHNHQETMTHNCKCISLEGSLYGITSQVKDI
jgi:hypothetical protein